MAAHERLITKASTGSQTLLQQLATVLPKDLNFKIYHLSTPPTRTSSLYSAPPGTRPDRSYCSSHFLSASIRTSTAGNAESKEVLVFAIEILIYSTAYDTTFFVSKADSTGYLHLLGLPKVTPSPLRDISTTFLRHLVEQHQRPNIRSVISLFARSQDQYLFPGSVEYSGKHVLDDRGLVRWWCRVLDPLIEKLKTSAKSETSQLDSVKAYLIVPGLDKHETLSYIPKKPSNQNSLWQIGHPLRQISRFSADVPPRCLIPHYPDDPKARFLDELDEEITKGRKDLSGQWKSVKSIDQFWDMMAFRQECSAGRLVGFIWVVFTPTNLHQPNESTMRDPQERDTDSRFPAMPDDSNTTLTPATPPKSSSQLVPTSSPFKPDYDKPPASQQSIRSSKPRTPPKMIKLSGPIIPRQPRVKTEHKSHIPSRPETSAYYVWRPEGRGQITVEESDYKRVTELLLRLDFANLELATSSSIRWINEVRSGAGTGVREAWGQTVTGTKVIEIRAATGAATVNRLNMGLVRKKRKAIGDEAKEEFPAPATNVSIPTVNLLDVGMIRKKGKV